MGSAAVLQGRACVGADCHFRTGLSVLAFAALKRNKTQRKAGKAEADSPREDSGGRRNGPEPGAGNRRRWFRLVALALPVLFLLLLEVALRLVGYGYPTGFFLKREIEGKTFLIENDQFARRYFPPGLARSPQPLRLPLEKREATQRIFIFGESAAMGDPAPAFGFGRVLEVLLRERFPGRQFEVVNVAVTAINSHVIRQIARDCADRKGDFWIVYMGNNEVVGPYGAGTVFGTRAPNLRFSRASIAFKSTRIGQWLDAIKQRLSRGGDQPETWEGMEMFLEEQVRQGDPAMTRVYEHFEENLRDILELGIDSGATVLLSTVAANLRDCAPFASLHRSDLTEDELKQWNRLVQDGAAAGEKEQFDQALAKYEAALKIDSQQAELHFRMGRVYLALKRVREAAQSFSRARDLDTLRFRVDSRLNGLITVTHADFTNRNVLFAATSEALASESPNGILGNEFLFEHVHLNFDGNYRAALLFAEAIAHALEPKTGGPSTNWLDIEQCAERLAFTDWDQIRLLDELIKRLEQPPFTRQSGHEERIQRFQVEKGKLESQPRDSLLAQAIRTYTDALSRAPGDWVLRENFANLLQAAGRPREAEEEWRKVIALMPHHGPAYYSVGNLLDAQGKSKEAIAFFEEALRRRPDSVEARNGLGLALANLGRPGEAVRQFEAAIRRRPSFTEARINLGQLLANQGKPADAIAQYEAALRSNSNSPGAHINLGKILSEQGNVAEAIGHYQAAVRLRPENAVAHFNLANALASRGDPAALQHYANAVGLDPAFAEARHNYGLALAKAGQDAEALAQFSEAVRLKPGFADAHLNLGVALAKQRRFAEAIQHFRETLRLDPQNQMARKFLDQAEALRR